MSQLAFAGPVGLAFMPGALAVAVVVLVLPVIPTVVAGLEAPLVFTAAAMPAAPVSACVLFEEVVGAAAPRPADITP